jgi:tRNA (Thr-GGU) A37 N-methylase
MENSVVALRRKSDAATDGLFACASIAAPNPICHAVAGALSGRFVLNRLPKR